MSILDSRISNSFSLAIKHLSLTREFWAWPIMPALLSSLMVCISAIGISLLGPKHILCLSVFPGTLGSASSLLFFFMNSSQLLQVLLIFSLPIVVHSNPNSIPIIHNTYYNLSMFPYSIVFKLCAISYCYPNVSVVSSAQNILRISLGYFIQGQVSGDALPSLSLCRWREFLMV